MIARIAERAIWRPKLADTFLTPNASALDGLRCRSLWNFAASLGRERLGPDLEALVAVARSSTARGPGCTASACADRARPASRTVSSDVGAGVVNAICVPPLKSMPEVEALDAERDDRDRDDGGRDREPEPPLADEVDLQPVADAAAGRSRSALRVLEHLGSRRAARGTRACASTAVSIEIAVPIRSISAKPRTDAVATANSTSAVIAVTTFASTIVCEALRVARLDRAPHRAAPGARLFLDAFEDDDVRVGGHPQRQHEAGEAGQRQRDVEEQDRRVEERRVDAEPEDGDDAEEAVEDEQEERDERAGRRAPPASPRSASPCRASPRSRSGRA